MARVELAETLMQLAGAIVPPEGTGLVVTEAVLEVPLEVQSGVENGALVFYGQVPHTRFRAGILPPVHATTLTIELLEAGLAQ